MPKIDLPSDSEKSGGNFDNSENAAIGTRCFSFAGKADANHTTVLAIIGGLK